MSRSRRLLGPRLIAALVLATAASLGPFHRPAPGDEVIILPDVRTRMNNATFNQWALGGRSLEVARQRFDTLLALKIEDVDRTCKLSDAQKQKLQLAGRGDMKRFADKIDEARRKVVDVPMEPNQLNQVLAELRPLQASVESDLFDERSIFAKTLKTCLTESQAADYDTAVREKAEFRFRSTIDLVVAMVDRSAGLSQAQRLEFKKLLLEETKPPGKSGPYDYYVIVWQVAKIPEPKVRAIFDDAQWRALKAHLNRAIAMQGILQQGGFLPAGAVVEAEPVPPA